MQANIDTNYGNSYASTKCFCVVGIISSENAIKLSGDISELKHTIDEKTVGDFYSNVSYSRALTQVFKDYGKPTLDLNTPLSSAMFSLTVDEKSASMAYRISSIDIANGVVSLVEPLSMFGFDSLDSKDENWFVDKFENDDNAFYLVGFPDIGNTYVENSFGQHVEGSSGRAIGRLTHVEGRDNIADVRYAHAEGSHNVAGEMASHAEGFINAAKGRYSHAEGYMTTASGQNSHTEGESTVASGKNSHAGGLSSRAHGDWSFANGKCAEASSFSTVAMGAYVSAYATNTIAMGTYAIADHKRAFVWNGIGNNT